MDEKMLIEITKQTVAEVDRFLRLDNSEYIKEFGTESDRTNFAKIEKAVNMLSTLNFFIDQYYSTRKSCDGCECGGSEESNDSSNGDKSHKKGKLLNEG